MTQWKIAFVVGITLFSMGLPLLIIGSTSTDEDRLAMLIPGAVMFSIGVSLTVVAAAIRNGVWGKGQLLRSRTRQVRIGGKGSQNDGLQECPLSLRESEPRLRARKIFPLGTSVHLQYAPYIHRLTMGLGSKQNREC